MDATFQCLSCGATLTAEEAGGDGLTATCPKCGRDVYRKPAAQVPSRYGGGVPAAGGPGLGPGVTRAAPALPSRYGGAANADRFVQPLEDEDHNPIVLPHTPFVVIIGLIFSFVPLLCFGGVLISYLGYRLVVDSPKGVRGKEMAIAGMILGGLMSLLTIYLLMTRGDR